MPTTTSIGLVLLILHLAEKTKQHCDRGKCRSCKSVPTKNMYIRSINEAQHQDDLWQAYYLQRLGPATSSFNSCNCTLDMTIDKRIMSRGPHGFGESLDDSANGASVCARTPQEQISRVQCAPAVCGQSPPRHPSFSSAPSHEACFCSEHVAKANCSKQCQRCTYQKHEPDGIPVGIFKNITVVPALM